MRKLLLVLSAVSVHARLCDDWAGTPCYWPEGYKICCGPSEITYVDCTWFEGDRYGWWLQDDCPSTDVCIDSDTPPTSGEICHTDF